MNSPTKAEISKFLARLRAAVDGDRLHETRYAERGRVSMGLPWQDAAQLLRSLRVDDFDERKASDAGPGTLWVFEPSHEGAPVYVKVADSASELRLVSFHWSERTEDTMASF